MYPLSHADKPETGPITSGADIQDLIEKFYKTPPAVVERIKAILEKTAQ